MPRLKCSAIRTTVVYVAKGLTRRAAMIPLPEALAHGHTLEKPPRGMAETFCTECHSWFVRATEDERTKRIESVSVEADLPGLRD